ncbi:PulJ/GspJ family protein [Aquimarina spinulae]|uniref:PulJ/GspJ family protein n=2 Tax=Aquimarina spinulae TaxID=1192023 RepID=UPI000D560435|nr:prepilin-type N-terminal cleavage/methylation domain-containing protein [Aquimarina spinulae]
MLENKKHTRLQAFTMLELVIGMVISSLVITMVYVIYDNLSRQVVVYADQQDDLMTYNQFQNLFSKDVQLSTSIDIDDDKHIVLESANKEIHYFFKTEKIIRKAEAVDTFNIKVLEVLFDQNEKIEEKYQIIKLKIEILGTSFDFFESKEISLASRMNNYLLDEY